MIYKSVIGDITVEDNGYEITRVFFGRGSERGGDVSRECISQLGEYFEGARREFSLPIHFEGTEFQKDVWRELLKIAYGHVCTYSDIAAKIGRPNACRAVGMANNKNPIAIIVPCHRVIGKDGALTGYAGGMDKKEYLLKMEKVSTF